MPTVCTSIFRKLLMPKKTRTIRNGQSGSASCNLQRKIIQTAHRPEAQPELNPDHTPTWDLVVDEDHGVSYNSIGTVAAGTPERIEDHHVEGLAWNNPAAA